MASNGFRINLRALGGLRVQTADGRELSAIIAQPKRLALLLYLSVVPGPHRRDVLVALFWPELSAIRARGALRKALQFLRHELGDTVLVWRGAQELLLDRTLLRCDVVEFRAAAEEGRALDALALYGGDLAPGLFVAGALGFEQWLDSERARLRELAAREARAAREQCTRLGDSTLALDYARRAVTLAPDDERTWRELIALLDGFGDRAGALQTYDALVRRLAAEYETEPAPETTRLIESVRKRVDALAPSPSTAETVGAGEFDRRLPHSHVRPQRRVRVLAALVGAVALAFVGAVGWMRHAHTSAAWARNVALPEVLRLADAERYADALALLAEVEQRLPADPLARSLEQAVAFRTSITSEPTGATVAIRDFSAEGSAFTELGRTPIAGALVPYGSLHWRLTAAGFDTLEFVTERHTRLPELVFTLSASGAAPRGMVLVPAGAYEMGNVAPVHLPAYWIDRFEVTNEAFERFVADGAYETPNVWRHSIQDSSGRVLDWVEAMSAFRDATGRPGPATWSLGTYPAGRGREPVGGVSWYEAVAYCEHMGKSLPTMYHWHNAAQIEFLDVRRHSNLAGSGPVPVGSRPSLNNFGAYDMAGNVKEWVWNAVAGRRYILGGDWTEPSYKFADLDALPPAIRRSTHGFRCAKYIEQPAAALLEPLTLPTRDFAAERPVDEDEFRRVRRFYDYYAAPLAAAIDSVDDRSPHWRIEYVSFDAAYDGERVAAYLFLPKSAPPPYQTVVWFPSGNAPYTTSRSPEDLEWFSTLVRTGRAVIYPIYDGMHGGRPRERSAGNSEHAWRDAVIHWSKDLGRSIDYLETRPDIDTERIAYFGFSMGGVLGPIMTAVEPRIRVTVLLGGGLWMRISPPEAEPLNFAPRVKVPVLMINGREDFYFDVERSQRHLFLQLGTPPTEKRHVVFDGGHLAPKEAAVRETLAWLDRYLGPIPRQSGDR